MAFKAVLWNDKGREIYGNNASIVGGIVSVLGFSVALFAMPSLKVALFIWGVACIIDDFGWIMVYYKNKKSLENLK